MGDGPMATACVGQSRTRKISTVESHLGREGDMRRHDPIYIVALGRLSRKFLRKLRGATERPKVDESCG